MHMPPFGWRRTAVYICHPLEATQKDAAHVCNSFGGGAGDDAYICRPWVATHDCVHMHSLWRRHRKRCCTWHATPWEAAQEDGAYICRPLGGDAPLCTYATPLEATQKKMRTYATPLGGGAGDDAYICRPLGGDAPLCTYATPWEATQIVQGLGWCSSDRFAYLSMSRGIGIPRGIAPLLGLQGMFVFGHEHSGSRGHAFRRIGSAKPGDLWPTCLPPHLCVRLHSLEAGTTDDAYMSTPMEETQEHDAHLSFLWRRRRERMRVILLFA